VAAPHSHGLTDRAGQKRSRYARRRRRRPRSHPDVLVSDALGRHPARRSPARSKHAGAKNGRVVALRRQRGRRGQRRRRRPAVLSFHVPDNATVGHAHRRGLRSRGQLRCHSVALVYPGCPRTLRTAAAEQSLEAGIEVGLTRRSHSRGSSLGLLCSWVRMPAPGADMPHSASHQRGTCTVVARLPRSGTRRLYPG